MRHEFTKPDKDTETDTDSVKVTPEELEKMQRERRIYEIQKAIDSGVYSVDAEDIVESLIKDI